MTGSVVQENEPPTEAEFRAAMLRGLARCGHSTAGRRSLAAEMDLSSKGLENILLRDAMPGPKRLFDATRACPSVLDDIATLYGFELVPIAIDPLDAAGTVPIAALLAKVAEAESPTSDGGVAKTHSELLAMEHDIRKVHALTAQWIHEITELRSPRAVG
jgi:hypothetical protein